MSHAVHALLTILTRGLWLPMWIVFALCGLTPTKPTRCSECNIMFRNRYFIL